MAAIVVQSRFAGLKLEDDDSSATRDSQKSKKNKIISVKKDEVVKKSKITNTKSQSANKKKKAKQPAKSADQWETWKQKDEELVDGNFETELQQAILLSKLDFEEKKDVYKQLKKEAEIARKTQEQIAKAGNKKQKKKNVMSLEQFNDMVNNQDDPKCVHVEDKESEEDLMSPDKNEEDFFERVKDETKSELLKDKIIDRVKHRQSVSDEIITRVQFADALEKKDKEILVLRQEVDDLKKELLTVKSRNKKLCNILGQGEMKDKAEVLVEVDRLRGVQAELTAEIESLSTELEKERSKNQDTRTKDKRYPNKKKGIVRFDVSSEALITKETST